MRIARGLAVVLLLALFGATVASVLQGALAGEEPPAAEAEAPPPESALLLELRRVNQNLEALRRDATAMRADLAVIRPYIRFVRDSLDTTKYEYKVEKLNRLVTQYEERTAEGFIKKKTEDGWEFVGMTLSEAYVFRRLKEHAPKKKEGELDW
jgi:hypothetical protein